MNRRESQETIQELKDCYNAGNYKQAVLCAEKLNLKKVREAKVLDMAGTAYEQCGEDDKALQLFNSIYEKYGASRQMAFKLCELSVKTGDLDGAVEYYNDFCRIAPYDNGRFLLKYEIGKAGGIERRELIKVLEAYVSKEKDEKWEYELARMYHEAGLENNCVKLCDDIFTWFADGEYVKKALELKFAHKALSPEQQERYEEMMEQRIIRDNPGRYVINGGEEAFETSSHIETFEAGHETKAPAEEKFQYDYDEDELVDTRVMPIEAVNREIDRTEEAPKITRFGTEPEADEEEPVDEEMTISLTAAVAANTRETEKAAILEAVLKAQELAAEGKKENNIFYAMEETAEEEAAEAEKTAAVLKPAAAEKAPEPAAVEKAPEPAAVEKAPESAAAENVPEESVSGTKAGVVKLDPVQASKIGTEELAVSPLAAYVSRPDLRVPRPVRVVADEVHQPEPAGQDINESEAEEIWLNSEEIFAPQPEEEVPNSPAEGYNDEEVWEEAPGPGPKLTRMADVSNIPMESSADGQIGIDLDMLTEENEGIEGQMTIDEVFSQYAQKVKENESKYAELEAERLRQIQEAVSGMVPTPLYEIEDEPEPDSPTKDVTMNVTELFSSGKAIEEMLKAAEDENAGPLPEAYNDDDDLSAIREVNIEEEITKRNAQKADPEDALPEEPAAEEVLPEAGVLEEAVPETIVPEAEDELPVTDELSEAAEAKILAEIEAGLSAAVEAEISAVMAEMEEPAAEEPAAEESAAEAAEAEEPVEEATEAAEAEEPAAEEPAAEVAEAEELAAEAAETEEPAEEEPAAEESAEEEPAEEKTAEEKTELPQEKGSEEAPAAVEGTEADDSDAVLDELLAMLDSMGDDEEDASQDITDIENASAEEFNKELDLEAKETPDEDEAEDDFDALLAAFESEKNDEDVSENVDDIAADLAAQFGAEISPEPAEEEAAAEKPSEEEAAEAAAAEEPAEEEAAETAAAEEPAEEEAAEAAEAEAPAEEAAEEAAEAAEAEELAAEAAAENEAEMEAEKFLEELKEDAGEGQEGTDPGNTVRLSDIDDIMAALLGETAADAEDADEEEEAGSEEVPAQEEPSENGGFELSDDLKKDLEEFLFIEGMEEAICDAVVEIASRKKNGDATGGNLIITGDSKTGKTYLAVNIIKAVTGEIGGGVEKVAKVQAQALNGKNIDKVFEKIGASDLIIENVGFLGDETIQSIITSMQAGKPQGMVVMEGNQLAVENIFYTFPEAKDLFCSRVDINELNIVQWSELACKYAETRGYMIDDMAQLALHARINEINLPTVRLGYNDIIKIVDSAIQKADKRNVGKLFSAFSHKHGDGMKEIIEADFE